MTRFRLFSRLFFVGAAILFGAALVWGPRPTPAPSLAGTYLLDRDALVQALLAADSPGRRRWEQKCQEVLTTLEQLPAEKAGPALREAEAMIQQLETELRGLVEEQARGCDVQLTLQEDGTFRLKYLVPEADAWLGRGRWAARGATLELTYREVTTLDGKPCAMPKGNRSRLQILSGKLAVKAADVPGELVLVRQVPKP